MAINLLENLQKNLGFAPLTKIDPNTLDVKSDVAAGSGHSLEQGAIPAVLLALYKYGNTEQGSQSIISEGGSTDWLSAFFGSSKAEAINKVSTYSGTSTDEAGLKMEAVASEAVKLIRQQVPPNASFDTVKTFINDQRSNILPYLPAEIQMGDLMNDNTIDDRTHKMEGPMSNNMHFFEKLFSGSTTEKNEKTTD